MTTNTKSLLYHHGKIQDQFQCQLMLENIFSFSLARWLDFPEVFCYLLCQMNRWKSFPQNWPRRTILFVMAQIYFKLTNCESNEMKNIFKYYMFQQFLLRSGFLLHLILQWKILATFGCPSANFRSFIYPVSIIALLSILTQVSLEAL